MDPLVGHLKTMLNYRKFRKGNKSEVDELLKVEKLEYPMRIVYGFGISHEHPGTFILTYIRSTNPHHEYIGLYPKGLKFRKRMFEDIDRLVAYFQKHIDDPQHDSAPSIRSVAAMVPMRSPATGGSSGGGGWGSGDGGGWRGDRSGTPRGGNFLSLSLTQTHVRECSLSFSQAKCSLLVTFFRNIQVEVITETVVVEETIQVEHQGLMEDGDVVEEGVEEGGATMGKILDTVEEVLDGEGIQVVGTRKEVGVKVGAAFPVLKFRTHQGGRHSLVDGVEVEVALLLPLMSGAVVVKMLVIPVVDGVVVVQRKLLEMGGPVVVAVEVVVDGDANAS